MIMLSGWITRVPIAGALLIAVAGSTGCATKKDLKLLRDEVVMLQQRQDSSARAMERQYRMLFDTLRTSFMAQLDMRGETSHRFQQLEQSLTQTQQMITDLQFVVTELRTALEEQRRAPAFGGGQAPPVSSGEARQMFEAYKARVADSPMAARAGLEQFLLDFPTDPLAAEAQYLVAVTYEREGNHQRAIDELRKVWGNWSNNHPIAAQAMLQAGIIAEANGERALARELYRDVTQRYPGETAVAQEASRRLRGGG
jgi:TolA-binding protein